MLTTLQAPRLKALMAGGSDYQSAYAQSRNEVLAVFGIDPAAVDNLGSLFDMRINGGSDQDAILLATSAILSQVARTQAPGTETAELSHLISSIAADLADHGKLSSSDLQAQLKTAAVQIDLDGVRRNVETYYANRGIALAAPRFEEWLDKDGSGVLPRRVIPVNGLVFNNVADAELRQIYSSNPVKVTGLPAGKNVAVSLTGSATLLKNHRPVSGRYTTAQNGDVFELQDRSLGFSQQVQSVLRVGSSNIGWQINSKQTGLELDTTYYPLSNSSNGSSKTIPANKLIAWKITPDHTFNAKYLGLDIQPDGKADDRTIHTADLTVGIYSDDAGKPGQQLLSSNNLTDLFDANTTVPSVNNGQKGSFLPASLQYLLGSSGISLQAGQTYWIVLAPPLNNKWGLSIKTMNGGTTSVTMYSTDGKNWSTCSGSMLSMYPGSSYCSSDYSSEFTPAIWLAR
ncbi:hypothetical protein [Chromobacterium sp. CV08]|uniref:hypothetical protein n=1 Tax=Chromobacterium sp. CV08 TaxID=3133274 RepID=UPI003DA8B38D